MTRLLAIPLVFLTLACGKSTPPSNQTAAETRPSILLVTLDTTRADSMGPDAKGVETPAFNALAARGRRFRQAYATTPQTLPSHGSMMTGLYPGGHGVHENGRYLDSRQPLLAEQLAGAGYRTAAFVSAFALARRFGLARGFGVYDDEFGSGRAQRPASETTDRALRFLDQQSVQPLFLWVHYYDPHYPYEPPEPFRGRYANQPYLGEVASMDEQLGRLVRAFDERTGGHGAVIVVADHGEGLGDHGEAQHGNLLYQETMLVPLVVAGPGIDRGLDDAPVSTRRVYHTILDWAGLHSTHGLGQPVGEVVAGEAMKPFLDYGWRPQVMAIEGRQKAIFAGKLEIYDVLADPGEKNDLSARADLSRSIRATLRHYPVPSAQAAKAPDPSDDEERRKLASLGYVASTVTPVVRPNAPRPVDMVHLFPILDLASGLFVREQYAEALPLLERIQREDPYNLDAALRAASAHSALGNDRQAVAAFQRAQAIAPQSHDVRTYLALHYARGKEWQKAIPMLEEIVAAEPDRLPPLEALARIRERQGRHADAISLRQKIYMMRTPSGAELAGLGELQMTVGDTPGAIASFESARKLQGDGFRNDLELGVLYLAARRFDEARRALDRVPVSHPAYPMALFKRAQVSVLLNEPDRTARIELARKGADRTTRELIARERLFQQ